MMSETSISVEYLEYVGDFARSLQELGWHSVKFRQAVPNLPGERRERSHAYRGIGWSADGDYSPAGRFCSFNVQKEYDGTVTATSDEVRAVGVCPKSAARALADRLEQYAADLREFAKNGPP